MGAIFRWKITVKVATAGGIWLTCITIASMVAVAANPPFLKRSVCQIKEQPIELSSSTAHYNPLFGVGDPNFADVKGIVRFGELTIEPVGSSRMVSYEDMIAIDFTLEHPDIVDALIPVASALNGYPYADAEKFESKFLAIFKAAKEEGLDVAIELLMELPFFVPVKHDIRTVRKMRTLIKENFKTWSKDQEFYIWPSPPAIQILSDIKVPTLVVVGDHDVTDILGIADTLISKIVGARKVVINGAGHHVNMEKPKEFDRAVTDFLNNL